MHELDPSLPQALPLGELVLLPLASSQPGLPRTASRLLPRWSLACACPFIQAWLRVSLPPWRSQGQLCVTSQAPGKPLPVKRPVSPALAACCLIFHH